MKTMFQPRRAEFVHRRPDNRILVENGENGVVIHATRNNFSPARKRAFVREIAAEGFIPDQFEWLVDSGIENVPGLIWIIDGSGAQAHSIVKGMATRRIVRILAASGVLWLALMLLLLAGLL